MHSAAPRAQHARPPDEGCIQVQSGALRGASSSAHARAPQRPAAVLAFHALPRCVRVGLACARAPPARPPDEGGHCMPSDDEGGHCMPSDDEVGHCMPSDACVAQSTIRRNQTQSDAIRAQSVAIRAQSCAIRTQSGSPLDASPPRARQLGRRLVGVAGRRQRRGRGVRLRPDQGLRR